MRTLRLYTRSYLLGMLALLATVMSWPALGQDETVVIPSADAVEGTEPQTAGAEATETIPTRHLLGIIQDGGIVMIPLLCCSFILTVFIFERAISLRRGRVIPGPFVKRFLHQLKEGQLDREQALGLCEGNDSPVAKIFASAVRKWGRPAVEVEQAIIDAGERATNDLRRYLRIFNGVATVTPLLGLLGTVFGMIQSFNDISTSEAMGRPELLAKGISEALLTTATGLTIAIPALTLYWFFVSRVDRLVMDIDALGQEVVNVISAEAIQEANTPRRSRREKAVDKAA